jgi:hypothetical protein
MTERLSDADLIDRARAFVAAKAGAKEFGEVAQEVSAQIQAELAARHAARLEDAATRLVLAKVPKADSEMVMAELASQAGLFEADGWKVAVIAGETVAYDFETARDKWRPSVLRRVLVKSINRKAVEAEIAAGRLLVLDAKAAKVVTPAAPYVRVTAPKAA